MKGAAAGMLTGGILFAIDKTIGLRVTPDEENEGLDATQHAETAYHQSGFGGTR